MLKLDQLFSDSSFLEIPLFYVFSEVSAEFTWAPFSQHLNIKRGNYKEMDILKHGSIFQKQLLPSRLHIAHKILSKT